MPQNEGAAIDPLAGGTFSRLLFSDLEPQDAITLDHRHFTFSSSDHQKPPKMLCFGGGDYYTNNILTPPNSATTTTDDNNNPSSPSPSSTTNSTTTSLSSNSNMKRNMRCGNYFQPVVLPGTGGGGTSTAAPVTTATRRNYKKTRAENTPPASHAKVKKEKLGQRIAALQQMVSPYGKTDTASVLHEALGYIKFLQEQVQVLCSPYLQRPPSAHIVEDGEEEGKGKKKDLGSKGLCLVPVECTLIHVAESNGADLWSPANAMVNPSLPLPLPLAQ